jgi:queuine tRNA-ribosyltransferase
LGTPASDVLRFTITHRDGGARRGRLTTAHGTAETPAFMPVGTAASVKALAPRDLHDAGAQIVLCNTYHLYLRPGHETVRALGGLHRFMAWDGPILTDSGGFQVWSMSEARTIEEEGVTFRSHLDGSTHRLTPESSVEIQQALGADIIMAFDECPPAGASREYHETSLARTTRWLRRCIAAHDNSSALFGIAQGGLHEDLRRRHIDEIAALDLPGYALGGYSVGETKTQMHDGVRAVAPRLPDLKPRYLMGVGQPKDLLVAVEAGMDMFDCVLPTRCARNGLLFTSRGKLVIRNAEHARSDAPADPDCPCYTCKTFTRAYLRHLFNAKELLAYRLNTLHNVTFYQRLMAGMRAAIETGRFKAFRDEFLTRYGEHDERD